MEVPSAEEDNRAWG